LAISLPYNPPSPERRKSMVRLQLHPPARTRWKGGGTHLGIRRKRNDEHAVLVFWTILADPLAPRNLQ
jgi:hypothetical protein